MSNTEAKNRAQLFKKVECVSNEIGKLEQDGTNSFSRYSYITHESATTAIRPLLKSKGLSLVFQVVDYTERDYTDAKGKTVIRTVVKMEAVLTDTETGHQEILPFFGAEQDSGGKSMQQAITQCTKYCMFKLFKITSKEEKDPDSKTTTAAKRKPAAKPKMTTAQKRNNEFDIAMNKVKGAKSGKELETIWSNAPQEVKNMDDFYNAIVIRGKSFKFPDADLYQYELKSGNKSYKLSYDKNGVTACSCPAKAGCKHRTFLEEVMTSK